MPLTAIPDTGNDGLEGSVQFLRQITAARTQQVLYRSGCLGGRVLVVLGLFSKR